MSLKRLACLWAAGLLVACHSGEKAGLALRIREESTRADAAQARAESLQRVLTARDETGKLAARGADQGLIDPPDPIGLHLKRDLLAIGVMTDSDVLKANTRYVASWGCAGTRPYSHAGRPTVGIPICELFARVGVPYDQTMVETRLGRAVHLTFKTDGGSHLVVLEPDSERWVVTSVTW